MRKMRLLLAVGVFFAFFLGLAQGAVAKPVTENARGYAHYMMGVMLDNFNQANEALEEFSAAKLYDPRSDDIRARVAIEYIRLNDKPKAINELNEALEINPDNLQVRTLLAFLYTTTGENQLAEIQYEIILQQAAQQDPQNMEAQRYLGQLYFQQRKFDKALEKFNAILQSDPKDLDAKLFLSLIYDETNKRPEAIKVLKEILEAEPENADALNALGYIYAESNIRLNEAEDLISKAIKQQPENGAYIDSLGWVYFKKGDFPKAKEQLEKAASLVEDATIFDHLADTYLKLGQKDKAKEAWQKALKLNIVNEKLKGSIEAKIKKLP
jgi:Tfp pilus assembly protein PilF